MSIRQKNITLTNDQQKYVKSHPGTPINALAKTLKMSRAKLAINMKFMGLSRYKKSNTPNWERNGFFDETEFAKLPIP